MNVPSKYNFDVFETQSPIEHSFLDVISKSYICVILTTLLEFGCWNAIYLDMDGLGRKHPGLISKDPRPFLGLWEDGANYSLCFMSFLCKALFSPLLTQTFHLCLNIFYTFFCIAMYSDTKTYLVHYITFIFFYFSKSLVLWKSILGLIS